MPAILRTTNKVSNFLAREQWRDRNFCREDVQVDLTGLAASDGNGIAGQEIVQVGMMLMQVGKTGAFKAMTAAFDPAADRIGIIVDERVGDPVFYNGTDMDDAFDATLGTGLQTNMNWGTTSTSKPTLALLVRGDAMIRLGGTIRPLVVQDPTETAKITLALKAQGIEILKGQETLYSTDLKRPFRTL